MSYRRNEIVFKSTPATVGDYKCMVEGCDYVTGSRTGMVLHGRIRHNIRYSREPSVVVHLCTVCCGQFQSASDLREHTSVTGHYIR